MQFSLRSATDILKTGGLLTQTLSEKDFNLVYDNRRSIIETNDFKNFYLTKPFDNLNDCLLSRKIASLDKKKYSMFGGIKSGLIHKSTYKKTCIRMIIRALYQKPELFGLSKIIMDRKICFSILTDLGVNVSLNYISQQKTKPFIPNAIPTVPETKDLIYNLKLKFPDLNSDRLLRK
jgi:hypothetical protein